MPTSSLVAVGDRIRERWLVREVLRGRGPDDQSLVCVVTEETTGETRVAKMPVREHDADVARFLREARFWLSLGAHPNIVTAIEADLDGPGRCLFLEYVPADDRGRRSIADHLVHGPVSHERARAWMIDACHGVIHAASKGLRCHRDIKPENLLIDALGRLKLADFGLAEQASTFAGVSADSIVLTWVLVGTPGYLAPEVALGQPADARADIYALGLVLHQLVTGRRHPPLMAPWKGDTRRLEFETANRRRTFAFPATTGPLAGIITTCLAYRPAARFQRVAHLLEALQHATGDRA